MADGQTNETPDTFCISERTVYVLTYAQSSKNGGGRVGDMTTCDRLDDALMVGRALQASTAGSKLILPGEHE